nr:immunoglobulin heavy chain junction region [Mus musculus]
CASNWDGDYW